MASELHNQLCLRAAKFLNNNGFSVAFDDRFQAATGVGELPDAIGFRNGVSCLIEAKVTRSDFLADKKKRFRVDPSLGMGDWRFFICPPGLIKPEELPQGWGLLYAHAKVIKKVHGFPPNTKWFSAKPFVANKQAECDFMYSALRRIALRGNFDDVYDRLSI
ncbi:hypothetical protein GCM10011607_28520 [Shewanella inventionis]|uniref:Uncharacterized protein n=1 Tax=Shewanella inventionis TaxID=1738770 RepID=A0ABQ1JDE5_9GAMM|nr:hypothetical protein [Shewanella inventionis]GGB66138.1 hypothetical protein GCM10011607_28520 [Shewanella inventionis]